MIVKVYSMLYSVVILNIIFTIYFIHIYIISCPNCQEIIFSLLSFFFFPICNFASKECHTRAERKRSKGNSSIFGWDVCEREREIYIIDKRIGRYYLQCNLPSKVLQSILYISIWVCVIMCEWINKWYILFT